MALDSGLKTKILENAARLEKALTGPRPAALDKAGRALADQAVDGVLTFNWLGGHPTRVGRRDIDWTGRHHAHQEWPAQLNRFFQLAPLAQAYRETGDERYAEAARDFIADWMKAHPARPGWEKAPTDNTLNLGIRIGHLSRMGWIGTLPDFLTSPGFDDAFVAAMLDSVKAQLAYEQAHMPNGMNWRIAASDCFVATGIRLEFLPEAVGWRDFGVKVLNDCWHRQVLPGGVHEERNPGYHTWMTRVMTGYCDLNRAMPELGLAMDPARVGRMWDYALAGTRPNGAFNGLHDCASDRTGDWSESRPAAAICRERESFLKRWGLPADLPPAMYFAPHAGQALWRTGWTEDDTYVTFDATVWGGGHCHLSRNSIQVHAFRQTMLADPGSLTYERSDPFSFHGKSTRAHNTCTLNGLNQSETNPQNTQVFTGPGYGLARSDYEGGYWDGEFLWGFTHLGQGIGASHMRWMLWIQDLGLIVMDSMQRMPPVPAGRPETPPSLACQWQFAENADVAVAADGSGAEVRYGPDKGMRMLFAHRPAGTVAHVYAGAREPLRGWLPADGAIVPAPQLVQELPAMVNRHEELVTVLLPWGNGRAPQPVAAQVEKEPYDRAGILSLRWSDGHVDEVHWTYRMLIMLGRRRDFESDAGLVHIRKDAAGRVVKAAAAGGTYLGPFLPHAVKAPGLLVWER